MYGLSSKETFFKHTFLTKCAFIMQCATQRAILNINYIRVKRKYTTVKI